MKPQSLAVVLLLAFFLVPFGNLREIPVRAAGAATPRALFAIIGDFGLDGTDEARVATLVKSWNPDFIITTGDNNYPSGAAATIDTNIGKYYAEFIYPYTGAYTKTATTNRFFPSLGNHDWYTTNAQPYLDYFTLPGNERYYDFVWGPAHFFAVDSDSNEPNGISSSSTQATWLQTQLAASTSCWNLVYFHHAPYSSGPHGSNPILQWPFQTWGADAVYAGHDHDYERIVLSGFPYFVNGSGGGALYAFGTPVVGSEARYNNKHGAMRVTATLTALTHEFINVDGSVKDTFTQSGGCSAIYFPLVSK
jgi:hypothetical protein